MPDTPLPRGPSAQLGLLFLAQSSPRPLLGSLPSNKSRSISGLAFSYPNLEQSMSHPAPSRTLTGRKPEMQIFHLLITLRNPDRTTSELGPRSQPFVVVTRDSFSFQKMEKGKRVETAKELNPPLTHRKTPDVESRNGNIIYSRTLELNTKEITSELSLLRG